jgi:hypothetical protein
METKIGLSEYGATVVNRADSVLNNNSTINIGVSGKRFVAPEERQRVCEEITNRINEIIRQHQVSDFVGFTALATGADTIFAQVVISEFHKPLHVILPFPLEEYKKDFSEQDLKTFLELLNQSSGTEVASSSLPQTPDDRNLGYLASGRRIVDACSDMVFVWDEQKPGGKGGTAEIMGYFAEGSEHRHVTYIKVTPQQRDVLDDDLIKGYEASNTAAMEARDYYRNTWKIGLIAGFLAACSFALTIAFHIEGFWGFGLACFEFACVVTVYYIVWFARKKNYHGQYLEKRCEAETYRLLKIFYHAGVKVKTSDRPGDEESVFTQLAGRINKQLQQNASHRKWYSQFVINELIRSQRQYHDSKVRAIGNKHGVYKAIIWFVGAAFLIDVTFHWIFLIVHGDNAPKLALYKVSVFLNMVLPAAYAALEGFIYFNEWSILKKSSISTSENLSYVQSRLPKDLDHKTTEDCHSGQAAVLNFISNIMLADNKNWKALLQTKDNYNMII